MKANIIRELAKSYIKKNKSFYRIISVTIIILTILLTVIGTLGVSAYEGSENINKGKCGNYSMVVTGISKEDIDKIKDISTVHEYLVVPDLPSVVVKSSNMSLQVVNDNYMNTNNIKLEDGKYPTTSNEIVIEEGYMKSEKVKIGDNLEIDELGTYKIVGVVSNYKFGSETKGNRLYIKELEEMKNGTQKLYINCNKNREYTTQQKLTNEFNIPIENIYSPTINNEVNINSEIIKIIVLIVSLILCVVFFLVNNIYASYYQKRECNIGSLVTIGATDSQIRSLFNYEVFIFASKAILVGLGLGSLLGYGVVRIFKLNYEMEYVFSYKLAIAIFIVMLLTVLISVKALLRDLNNRAPIEILRSIKKSKTISFKESKDGKKAGKSLFKDLAFANIRRNKKSIIINIISVSLAGILAISVSTMFSSIDIKEFTELSFKSDVEITPDETNIDIEKIKNMNYVEELRSYKVESGKEVLEDSESFDYVFFDVYIVNNTIFKEITKNNKLDIDKEVILGDTSEDVGEDLEGYPSHKFKEGDKLKLSLVDIISANGALEYKEKGDSVDIKISSILYESQYEYQLINNSDKSSIYYLVIHEDSKIAKTLSKEMNNYERIQIEAEKGKESDVKENILETFSESKGLSVKTFQEVLKEEKSSFYGMIIGIYSIIVTIEFMVIFNLIISFVAFLMSRRKEFGLFRAIGLKDKELKKMVGIECSIINSVSIFIIVTLGNLLGYLAMAEETDPHINLGIDWKINLIIIGFILISQKVIRDIVIKKLSKEAIVEQIKNEE